MPPASQDPVTAQIRDARGFVSDDGGKTWIPQKSTSGGGGSAPSGTIGAGVPATASPIAVKDASGNLAYPSIDVSGNLLVAVTGAGSGGTSSTDGAGYTAGTTAGTPLMAARDDAGTTTLAEDKVGIVRATGNRGLHVNLRDNSGVEVSPATSTAQATGNTSLGNIDTNAGATADAAVTGDSSGTLSAKLRGISKILADMWDSVNHRLNVFIQNGTLAVTQSGSWTIASGTPVASTATLANVAENTGSVTLLALNVNRLGWTIVNDSDAAVNVKFGSVASATSYVIRVLPRNRCSHADFGGAIWTGIVTGIWDTAPGTAGHSSARVTELTA